MLLDFFRSITTTYFKPPKPTLERLEQRQEEWRRRYMPYATPTPAPKPTSTSSSLSPSTVRTIKPPSPPPITPPRISPPKLPTFHGVIGLSHQIRRELRREGVPVWYYTGKLQMPTPQKVWKGIQYITGFASKLAERAERKYESVVVQPVLAKVAPRGEASMEQVRKGVVGGLVRTPIAVTGIPMLRMGFKGIATPSGLKKEFGEMVEYAKKRPFEVGAETATSILAPYAYKKLPVRPTVSVAEFPKGRIASFGIEIKKLHGEATFKPLVSVGKPKIVKPISLRKPKIRGEILSKEAYTPQTPLERVIALEYMRRKAPFEIGKIEWGIRSQQIIKGVKAKPRELGDVIRDVVEKEHKLPEGVSDVVIKELKKAKARVYGSVMQEAIGRQFGVKALPRTPRDIDVQVRNPAEFAKRVAEAINKKAGREVVKVEGESVIVRATGEKLFDIHPIGFGEVSVEGGILAREGGYLAYGFKTGKLIKTKEKIWTTTLSEQALRKFSGAVELRAKPVEFGEVRGFIAPAHAGRVKDIFDYFFAGKATAERLRMLGKYRRASELEFRLNRWIESWGKDIAERARKMWEEAQKQGRVRVELGTFERGVGVRELMRPSLAIAGKSTAISASVFAVKSPFLSSFYTTSPAVRSAFTSLSSAVRSSGLMSRSVSRGVSGSVVSSITSTTPSASVSRSTTVRKSLSPLTSISSSVFSAFTSTSSTVSQMSKGSVSKSEFSKFSRSVSKVSKGGKSVSSVFFSLSSRAEYPKWKRRKRKEFEFRKMLEEGVANKFLKITPIATPEVLIKGVLRR
ncbi:MAG: hypothetical protein EJNHJLOP_00022 [Methanophagales virus PBV082]|uniref:Uncharacterized protein n=1 Tax=Methanophagales virus PBV082 TaxID=3071307 RepID=A0AA46YIN6_9VIRU|nr:MAG: hypothetical protein QIT52_gp22 [Methanophagales virus PBV082]UYL64911.1 MAG: hypothetical protein EJNHJLOP_00022 [Methanophagales virus PBV082]